MRRAMVLLLVGACSPSVEITVVPDSSLDKSIVGAVAALDFAISGAESAQATRPLSRPFSEERIVYNPGAKSGQLTVAVTALDAMNGRLLFGKSDVRLGSGAVSTRVVLTTDVPPVMGPARLQANGTAHDFGDGLVGASSLPFSFTITNNGGEASGSIGVSLAGAGAPAFTLDSSCDTLTPGASCTVGVRFTPGAPGKAEATLLVAADPGGDLQLALSGNGLDPGALAIAPTAKDFGAVAPAMSQSATFTVRNDGDTPTGTLAVGLSGSGAAAFATDGGCAGASLAAHTTCEVVVTFTPVSVGSFGASLTVQGNPGGAAVATVQGMGVQPASLAFSPSAWDFSAVDAGATASKTLTLTNHGDEPTGMIAIATSGDTTPLTITRNLCDGATLQPGESCELDVQFAPSTVGARQLTVRATGTPGGTTTATLSGTGRIMRTLTVTRAGAGLGSISATGLACSGNTCTGNYPQTGTAPTVAIAVNPDAGSDFSWSGDCTGSANPCQVTLDQNRAATITFSVRQLGLAVTTQSIYGAAGSVASDVGGINCGATCATTMSYGTTITLTATPSAPNLFQRWSGDCSGTQSTCMVSLTQARNVTAIFRPNINYAFVTSQTYVPGNFGSRQGADNACQARANAAGLGGNYLALVSTSAQRAVDRLDGKRGWIRPDGLPFADDPWDLLGANKIFYPLATDETGAFLDGALVATGAMPGGITHDGYTCSDWSSTTGSVDFSYTNWAGDQWVSAGTDGCADSLHLFCMQNDYTTPVSPAPIPGLVVFITKAIWDPSQGVNAADTLCRSEAVGFQWPSSKFKAVLSTTTQSALSRFTNTGIPYATLVRPDGIVVAQAGLDFFQGTLRAAANVTAGGQYLPYSPVWTGAPSKGGDLTVPGTAASTCNNWSSGSASDLGMQGIAGQLYNKEAIASVGFQCVANQSWESAHLYCLVDP